MQSKRTFNLLSRITFFYLIFTFVVFYFNAKLLTKEADEFIDSDLNRRFGWIEGRVEHHLKKGRSIDSLIGGSVSNIQEISSHCKKTDYPITEDITIYHPEIERNLIHRRKVVLVEANGKFYRVSMDKEVQNYYYFRDDIFEYLIPSFIVLVILIVAFNVLLQGYFLRPFRRILEAMQNFKVGGSKEVEKVSTTTKEFVDMQDLFTNMIERIDADYNHLKEYTEDVAHEIQTPLAIIRNKSESLLFSEKLEEEDAKMIKTIYDEANHLSKLGTTLNLITKIENGEFTDIKTLYTIEEIRNQVEAVEELAQLKSLSIEMKLDEEHALNIDPYLFDIILKNLLKNAIRYGTAEGPIKIETTSTEFRISNYGAPLNISKDQLFKRFVKGSESAQSLGLGLALVAKICSVSGLKISYGYERKQHVFLLKK
ncbi:MULTISPECIES: sensor histidine kinase [Flammeovirga]|uniref:histidine kinase n=1 Tax=Flammeovirga agarivorans TaxID=2726742 RepID=A0A7X8XU89_9BACT|nr:MULTISPECIES: HAMP domain-containing sensor histidine kinase [Flammeovirga]NLR90121.1 HAMP domain-containing histidine kinase [Flammeovirga agarivorans]